jgi:hypothetical protein
VTLKHYSALLWLPFCLLSCDVDDQTPPQGIPDPEVLTFSPDEGQMTQTVSLHGKNFSPILLDNIVQFNGTPAFVQSASPELLTVIVPDSATTGKITVTVGGKASTSEDSFTILSPAITGIFPPIGSPGLKVLIEGAHFLNNISHDHVFVGSSKATTLNATPTLLEVEIPEDATTGKIVVQVGTQKAVASDHFEICGGMPELIISHVTIKATNDQKTELSFSCRLTNVGDVDLDLATLAMQNYVSSDATYDVGDLAAGGWILDAGGVLQQGESYETTWSANADYSARPYLIVTVFAKDGQELNECNTANNVATKLIE